MLTLTLLRHAKSSWSDTSLDDFARPLAPRGLKAAPKIGKALTKIGPKADAILCSPAERTKQTAELVAPHLAASGVSITYHPDIYHASPDLLIDRITTSGDTERHIVLIGHNPGLEILALQLVKDGDPSECASMARKFPTAAAAQMTFDVARWPDIEQHTATLTAFITPRGLA